MHVFEVMLVLMPICLCLLLPLLSMPPRSPPCPDVFVTEQVLHCARLSIRSSLTQPLFPSSSG
eukprot:2878168-Rhodomonas_salina.2